MLSARNVTDGQVIFDDFRLIAPEAFEVEDRRTNVKPGDVLLTIVGTIGRCAVVGDSSPRFTLQRSVAVIKPIEISAKCLMYALQSPHLQSALADAARGTAQKGVYLRSLSNVVVPLSPRAEQDRIVAEIEKQFTRLDAGVAALKRVQANLKRYRASVLKAACEGRLVPTEAELARREGRSYEPASELLKRILVKRKKQWAETETGKRQKPYRDPLPPTPTLSELPEGWVWARWEQVGFSQNGRLFPSAEYSPTGVRLLRPGNLDADGCVTWDPGNTRRLPPKWAHENPAFLVRNNELIMNLTAQSLKDEFLGRICLTTDDEPCMLNQRLARLTPVLVDKRYLLWLFKALGLGNL